MEPNPVYRKIEMAKRGHIVREGGREGGREGERERERDERKGSGESERE